MDAVVADIPSWVIDIFNQDQRDPDKDPGFVVTARLWAEKGDLLMESSFMYVGQSDVTLLEPARATGTVHSCTVHWKGKSIPAEHDMKGSEPVKGTPLKINLHNLQWLGSVS